jgi:hypothetical protein
MVMKRERCKSIQVRIPKKYKPIFYKKKQLVKEEIDNVINSEKPLKVIELQDIYDGRVFFTVDQIYYQKLEELAERYNISFPKVVRSLFFSILSYT